jgi:HTH-type transcriptional regulator / antitoxin HigA
MNPTFRETERQDELVPDWTVHPGAVLASILEERSIRQSELAERTGMTAKHVSQIVRKSVGISGDTAVLLERALDIPARYWTRLDADYVAYEGGKKARDRLPEYASWLRGFDVSTLQSYGITRPDDSDETRAEKVLRFFGVASPEAFDRTWLQPRVSFRRSQKFTVAEQNTALWLRLVERKAQRSDTGPLQARKLRKVARDLSGLTTLGITDGFAAAEVALADAGVTLVFVREVPQTRITGATWWLPGDRPVIGVTERHHKPDIIWFTIAHEIGHLLLHPRRQAFLDLDTEKADESDQAEVDANQFAQGLLLPPEANEQIAAATTRAELAMLAVRFRVGATIVAGRHGTLTRRWPVGAKLRPKVTESEINFMEGSS